MVAEEVVVEVEEAVVDMAEEVEVVEAMNRQQEVGEQWSSHSCSMLTAMVI